MYLKNIYSSFFFSTQLGEPSFPSQVLNPCHLHWEHIVLTTAPPGRSPENHIVRLLNCQDTECN